MRRARRRNDAVNRIAGRIVGGRFAPGDTLPTEPMIGEEFAVRRTVVRESLKTLGAKGSAVSGLRVGTRSQLAGRTGGALVAAEGHA